MDLTAFSKLSREAQLAIYSGLTRKSGMARELPQSVNDEITAWMATEGQQLMPKKITNVELLDKMDTLKPGQWWSWSCEVTFEDGTSATGTIESDEHMHALETFEAD